MLIGVIGWFVLVARGEEMPDSLGTIMSTIAGGLVGALTMGGLSRDKEEPPPKDLLRLRPRPRRSEARSTPMV